MNRETDETHERANLDLLEAESSSSAAAVDELVNMPLFLNDKFIKSLVDRCITLGFSLESIMDLLRHNFRTVSADLIEYLVNEDKRGNTVDLSAFIKEEMFIHQLITKNEAAFNNAVRKSSKVSSSASDDLSDSGDHVASGSGVAHMQHIKSNAGDVKKGFDLLHKQQQEFQRQQQQILLETQNKKAQIIQKIQQEQLDQYNQSLSRINSKSNLRPIIVDSNDVASPNNSNKQVFIFSRIVAVVRYFEAREHQVYVILSQWRREQIMSSNNLPQPGYAAGGGQQHDFAPLGANHPPISDQEALLEMEKKGQILYTPSKRVGSRRIICDDDSYILKLASTKGGIIVSNDNFKRFLNHSEDFKLVIEERVLMYSFIDGTFMPAEDPLGKNGPSLANFLRFESLINQQFMKRCPYRKKCTFGAKCKFWHPERVLNQNGLISGYKSIHQSILDDVQEQKKKLDVLMSQPKMQQSGGRSMGGVEGHTFASSISALGEDAIRLQQGFNKAVAMGMDMSGMPGKNMNKAVNLNQYNNYQMLFPALGQSQTVVSATSSSSAANELLSNVNLLSIMNQKIETQVDLAKRQKILASQHVNTSNPSPSSSSSSSSNFILEKGFSGLRLAAPSYEPVAFRDPNKQQQQQQQQQQPSNTTKDEHKENDEANGGGDLRSQLLKKLDQDKVDRVLREYKNETDVEKLIFLAGAYSFDSFGF